MTNIKLLHYYMEVNKRDIHDIALLLNLPLETTELLLKGKQEFTAKEMDLVSTYLNIPLSVRTIIFFATEEELA